VDLLVAAMARLPEARCVIVGDGPLRAALAAQAARCPNVTLVGHHPHAEALMPGLDVLCLPSRWEGLGLVLVEAMLRGVLGGAGAIPKCHDGAYGVLFERGRGRARGGDHACDRRTRAHARALGTPATFSVDRMVARTLQSDSSPMRRAQLRRVPPAAGSTAGTFVSPAGHRGRRPQLTLLIVAPGACYAGRDATLTAVSSPGTVSHGGLRAPHGAPFGIRESGSPRLPSCRRHCVCIDRRPPEWDHANHLERALRCYQHLAEGRVWTAVIGESTFYPPLVPCAAGALYLIFPVTPLTAQAVLLGFLALGLAATFGAGRALWDSRSGFLAAFFFGTAPFVVFSLLNFQLDLPLAAMVAATLCVLLQTDGFRRARSVALGPLGLGLLTKPTHPVHVLGPPCTRSSPLPEREARAVSG
jgi:hypothetical protein